MPARGDAGGKVAEWAETARFGRLADRFFANIAEAASNACKTA